MPTNRVPPAVDDPWLVMPFHGMYIDVQQSIDAEVDHYPAAYDATWIKRINERFADEYDGWESSGRHAAYFGHVRKLRPRILRTAAAAYLHVSYDLPRVLANELAAGAPDAEAIRRRTLSYSRLEHVLRVSFHRQISRMSTVGVFALPGLIAWFDVSCVLSQWVLHLRMAALVHAELLRSSVRREEIEANMLKAMSAAIEHVGLVRNWPQRVLAPPNQAFGFAPVLAVSLDWPTIGWAIAIIGGVLAYVWWQTRRMSSQLDDFKDALERDRREYHRLLQAIMRTRGEEPDDSVRSSVREAVDELQKAVDKMAQLHAEFRVEFIQTAERRMAEKPAAQEDLLDGANGPDLISYLGEFFRRVRLYTDAAFQPDINFDAFLAEARPRG